MEDRGKDILGLCNVALAPDSFKQAYGTKQAHETLMKRAAELDAHEAKMMQISNEAKSLNRIARPRPLVILAGNPTAARACMQTFPTLQPGDFIVAYTVNHIMGLQHYDLYVDESFFSNPDARALLETLMANHAARRLSGDDPGAPTGGDAASAQGQYDPTR